MTILAGRIPDRGITYSPAYMCVWLADVVAPGLTDRPMWINERVAWNYKPDQLKWATNGHVSELTLSRQLGEGPGRDLQEHPESPAGRAGDRVILRQGVDGIEWFRGYLGKTETRIGAEPDGETYRITAYGPEIVLDGNVVSGQWHKIPSADNEEIDDSLTDDDRNGSSAFRSQWPVIFNENGKPNASESNWRLGGSGNLGNHCKVFEPAGRIVPGAFQAVYWTVSTALRSLVEVVDGYEMISELTDWQAIAALTGPGSIGEVDVEGMGLLQAINAVLSPAGFGFVIEPWAVQRGGGPPAHRLLVFSKSTVTTRKRPFLAPCGVSMDSEEGRRSELQQMSFVRDSRSVSNDVTVHGDNKRLEVTLAFTADSQTRQLHPAWDTYEHDLGYYAGLSDTICPLQWSADQMETFARNYHKSGDGFWQFKDVFRSFTFNEDGAFTSILGLYPPDIGDVSAGLADENGAFLARPRRLGPTLQYGSSGSQLHSAPARVEMCIAGCDDAKVLLPVQFWPDRCGFTLRLDEFFSLSPAGIGDIYRPFAQLTGSEYKINDIDRTDEIKQASWLNLLLNTIDDYDGLKVRIELICTLPADSRVTGKAGRRLESDWPFRSEKVISMPQRFQSQRSLAGDNDIDQTSEALAMAESIRSDAEQPMVKGVFSLRYLSRAYVPGDGINFTAGRVVDLVNGPDGGDTSMITSVLWSFGPGKNKTQLQIQNPKGG